MAEADNAWPLILQAAERYVPPEELDLDGNALRELLRDEDILDRDVLDRFGPYVEANAEALALIDRANERPSTFAPIARGMHEFDQPDGGIVRGLMHVRLLEAYRAVRDDDPAGAIDHLAALEAYSCRVAAAGYSMIPFLQGLAMSIEALEQTKVVLQEAGGDEAVLRHAGDFLQQVKPLTDHAVQAVRAEYWGMFVWELAELDHTVSEVAEVVDFDALGEDELRAFEEHPLLDRTATIEFASAYYAGVVEAISAPTLAPLEALYAEHVEAREAAMEERMVDARSIIIELMRTEEPTAEQVERFARAMENIGGEEAFLTLVPSFARMSNAERQHRLALAAMRIIVAGLRYELANGQLPESLDALVEAGLLDAVPVDPFDGEPLRYDADTRRIWSVGRDGKDHGGQRHERFSDIRPAGPDFVWDIPKPRR